MIKIAGTKMLTRILLSKMTQSQIIENYNPSSSCQIITLHV